MPQVQAAMCVQSSVWPGAACRAIAGQRTDGCVRVGKQSGGAGRELTGAGGQSGAGVEAKPAHPKHGGADDGERDRVRPGLRVPRRVLGAEARARAQHEGDHERRCQQPTAGQHEVECNVCLGCLAAQRWSELTDAGGGVDDDAACEVDGAAAVDAVDVFLGAVGECGAVAEGREPAAAPHPVACAHAVSQISQRRRAAADAANAAVEAAADAAGGGAGGAGGAAVAGAPGGAAAEQRASRDQHMRQMRVRNGNRNLQGRRRVCCAQTG